jgi:hypothetical protein
VIHDLSWHEWLIDANRLVKDNSDRRGDPQQYGPEAHQQFKSWLQDVAQGEKPARDAGEAALGWIRQGVSVAGLGFNVMSALMQPLGMTQSIVRIGPATSAAASRSTIAAPISTTHEISGMSSFMAERFRRSSASSTRCATRSRGRARSAAAWTPAPTRRCSTRSGMVDVPTWWGAYEKAIAEGNDEERAVAWPTRP